MRLEALKSGRRFTLDNAEVNHDMIKMLTHGQDWEYHSQHEDEEKCLDFIKRHGMNPRNCMLEFGDGTLIRVDRLAAGEKSKKPLMGILPV